MKDNRDVVVAKMSVWVKSTLSEVKNIKDHLGQLEDDIKDNYNELVKNDSRQDLIIQEIVTSREGCEKNFESLHSSIKDHECRIPSKFEIADRRAKQKRIDTMWDRYKYTMGFIAAVILITTILIKMFK